MAKVGKRIKRAERVDFAEQAVVKVRKGRRKARRARPAVDLTQTPTVKADETEAVQTEQAAESAPPQALDDEPTPTMPLSKPVITFVHHAPQKKADFWDDVVLPFVATPLGYTLLMILAVLVGWTLGVLLGKFLSLIFGRSTRSDY